jgi:uncharacterized protein (TIGR00106 family)
MKKEGPGMVLCELTMFPTDKGISVSPWVARILSIIDQSGLRYQLTPMGTIIEGEWDEALGVVGSCFRELEKDCDRINVSLKVDYRRGDESRLRRKVETVEQLVGRKLST